MKKKEKKYKENNKIGSMLQKSKSKMHEDAYKKKRKFVLKMQETR